MLMGMLISLVASCGGDDDGDGDGSTDGDLIAKAVVLGFHQLECPYGDFLLHGVHRAVEELCNVIGNLGGQSWI